MEGTDLVIHSGLASGVMDRLSICVVRLSPWVSFSQTVITGLALFPRPNLRMTLGGSSANTCPVGYVTYMGSFWDLLPTPRLPLGHFGSLMAACPHFPAQSWEVELYRPF